MRPIRFSVAGSICTASILGVCLVCGCSSTQAVKQHPDEIDSVNNALAFNGLSNVNVFQDRNKGVMTLTGKVQSADAKTQAAGIASTNAGDYTIVNDVGITPPASSAKAADDNAIKDKYQAMLKAHKVLGRQDIDCKVDHGTLVLSGHVHSATERAEAVRLAKSLPDVQRVVNEIKAES